MSGSRKRWNPEKGFESVNTGKGTIAEQFDDEHALVYTPEERKEQLIKDTMEHELIAELSRFETKLNKKTPLHKHEILLQWLEMKAVETVVDRQERSKAKSALLRNSATLEERNNVRGVLFVGSTVAKSSLLGQDPFGDERELPRSCCELVEVDNDATTEEDPEVTVSLGEDNAEAETNVAETREDRDPEDDTRTPEAEEVAGAEAAQVTRQVRKTKCGSKHKNTPSVGSVRPCEKT